MALGKTSLERDVERADRLADFAGGYSSWTEPQVSAWRGACIEVFVQCYKEGKEDMLHEMTLNSARCAVGSH
jgi:hypothetical protein